MPSASRTFTLTGMTPQPSPEAGAAVKAADRAHVFHSWSAQDLIDPLAVAGAEGSYFWDYDGTRYLDFTSGLVFTNIGYQHPKVVAAIQEQAAKLTTFAPAFAVEARLGGGPADRRAHPRRPGQDLLHQRRRGRRRARGAHGPAAHGPPQGARGVPLVPRRHAAGHQHHRRPAPLGERQRHERRRPLWAPFLYRSRFYAETEEQECARALEHLETTIAFEGPGTIAAIILETVPGTAGIMVPPPGYLAGVRELCDKYGIVFVLDEVMAGFGRTGEWFAADLFGVTPDLMTFAKGVNSGYVPLGGVALSQKIADTFGKRPLPGRPHLLRPSAGLRRRRRHDQRDGAGGRRRERQAARRDRPRPRPRRAGRAAPERRRGARRRHVLGAGAGEGPGDPRAAGAVANAAGEANAPMAAFAAAAKKNGLWPFVNMNRTHVVPPCNATEAELKAGLAALDAALSVADEHTV